MRRHGTTSGRTGRPQAPCMRGGVCVSRAARPRSWRDRGGVDGCLGVLPQGQSRHSLIPSMRRPSARGTSIVMSRSMTLVATRAPASRQTRAAALSNAAPRGPKTPAVGHAVWWSPKASGTPPHRHCRGPTTGCFWPESGGVSLLGPCSQGTRVPTGYSFRISRGCPRPLGHGGR